MDVTAGPIGEDEPEEKPKRGFAAWTPEEREAARIKSAETRARNKEERATPTARLETAEPRIAPKQPKGKKPSPVTTFDREVLVKAFGMVNLALDLTAEPTARWTDGPMQGQCVYSLSREEIEQLANAWFEVAKRYPMFGSFIVAGRTVSVWGDVIIVTLTVAERRVKLAALLRQQKLGQAPPPRPAPPAPNGPATVGPDGQVNYGPPQEFTAPESPAPPPN